MPLPSCYVYRTWVFATLVSTVCSGCTTTRPVNLPPEELQQRIAVGELVEPGDSVRVVTMDGTKHDLVVSAVTQNSLVGNKTAIDDLGEEGDGAGSSARVELPLAEIAALEQRELTGAGQAGAAAAGVGLAVGIPYVLFWLLPIVLVGALAGL